MRRLRARSAAQAMRSSSSLLLPCVESVSPTHAECDFRMMSSNSGPRLVWVSPVLLVRLRRLRGYGPVEAVGRCLQVFSQLRFVDDREVGFEHAQVGR